MPLSRAQTAASARALTTAKDFASYFGLDTSTASGHTTNTYNDTSNGYSVGDYVALSGGTPAVINGVSQVALLRVTAIRTDAGHVGQVGGLVVQSAGQYTVKPSGNTNNVVPYQTANAASSITGTLTVSPIFVQGLAIGIPDDMTNNSVKLYMVADGATNTVANGATDNFPLLKKAIAAAAGVGLNYLLLTPGAYACVHDGTTADLPASFTLMAVPGAGATLKVDPSSWTGVTSGQTRPFLRYNNKTNIIGITIDGQRSLVNGGVGTPYSQQFINRTNQTDSDNLFMDIRFVGQVGGSTESFCISSGYASQRQRYVRVDADQCGGTPISINGDIRSEIAAPGTSLPQDIDIVDCRGTNCGWQGFTAYCAKNIRIVNFYGAANAGQGINLEWCSDIKVLGGTCENNMGFGVGGFSFIDKVILDGVTIRNNALKTNPEYNYFAEIGFKNNDFYTADFVPAAIRNNQRAGLRSLTIRNCEVTPKTVGQYALHLHIESGYEVTYPDMTASQPSEINIDQYDWDTWRCSYRGGEVYADNAYYNGGSWMPNYGLSVGNTRVNAGLNIRVTTAGTTANYGNLGPGSAGGLNVGDTVQDGTVTWTVDSVYQELIYDSNGKNTFNNNHPGAPFCRGFAYTFNDIRSNNGYCYRLIGIANGTVQTTGASSLGPVNTNMDTTEVVDGMTWYCHGKFTTSGDSSRGAALGYTPKNNDTWPPNVRIRRVQSFTASCVEPIINWTPSAAMTVAPYTGGGDHSGRAALLTSTAVGTASGVGCSLTATRLLQAGQPFVAKGRYMPISGDRGLHFAIRPPGWNGGTGDLQFDVQLTGNTGSERGTTWYNFEIPFTMNNSVVSPFFYIASPQVGAQFAVEVDIIPVLKHNTRNAETFIGGRKFSYDLDLTKTSQDFEVNDCWKKDGNVLNDAYCTTAGSYGAVNSATTFTTAGGTAGTLSQVDPAVRPGMWLSVAGGAGGSAARISRVKRVDTSVTPPAITFYNSMSAVSGAALSVVAPVFVAPGSAITSPATPVKTGITAYPQTAQPTTAAGTPTAAPQLILGINEVTTAVATAAPYDCVRAPSFSVSGTCIFRNATGNKTVNIQTADGTGYINGASGFTGITVSGGAQVTLSIIAGENLIFRQ